MGIPDVLFGPARGADCASAVRAAQGTNRTDALVQACRHLRRTRVRADHY